MLISELQVMKSAAGYYVGRVCYLDIGGQEVPMPYSRDFDYFRTEKEAEKELQNLLAK